MNLLLTFRIAARALAKNKMRAGLTVLGIVIGIAAVITMVSVGQSASAMVQDQFTSLGTNVIFVIPGSQQQGGVRQSTGITTLTADDSDAVVRECPAVWASSPIVVARGQVISGNVNWSPNEIYGVNEDYFGIRNWTIAKGDAFTQREISAAAKVCVIGHTIVEKMFQTTNPIGHTIRIKNVPFQVIGVLERKGANMVGVDQDNIILAPHTTIKKRISQSAFNNVDYLIIAARSIHRMHDAQQEIQYLLRERHHIRTGQADDFTVRDTSEVANVFGIITGVMTMLLASIASVSLLVGGVGIMNIMLVSVTERTREIGIRMAVGARGGDILRQFLVESMLLSAIGGVVGIALGLGASVGITSLINTISRGSRWPLVISTDAIILAMVVSSAVGIFFGFYPARKASRLDPIDCLRYE